MNKQKQHYQRDSPGGGNTENLIEKRMPPSPPGYPTETVPVREVIGTNEVLDAFQTLLEYKRCKANLEQMTVENEQWYKLRHWDCMRREAKNEVEPVSGWLFNALANKHADCMDNFPCANILPREAGDTEEANRLRSIVPVVLEQTEFERVYDAESDYKLKQGTGIYGVFWDGWKYNGLGDITIRQIDLLNLFWESGITDIQESRNVFLVHMGDSRHLEQRYPQLRGKLGGLPMDVCRYIYDDTIDTTGKSLVVDWYYKKDGRLHFCQFCSGTVLYATENDPDRAHRGWYDHGLYPFIFDPLFRIAGTPVGFGYIAVAKSAQEYIDRGNQAIMQNLLANARPRHFVRSDGSVNEKEYADISKDFIHVDGNLGQDSIIPVTGKPLNDIYVTVINNKIEELKETTGNRDVSTGGSTSGVTAASAIAAMQEAGSKLSRDHIKAGYRAFRSVVQMVIELIRQFYDIPRQFRIIGAGGAQEFILYSNAGIVPQDQGGTEFGVDMGMRVPLFDVQISAEKASPYSKMAQNELALQFYGAGFFNPALAQQSLAALQMMDFDKKEDVIRIIQQNAAMYQAAAMAAGAAAVPAQSPAIDGQTAQRNEALGGNSGEESYVTKNARQKAADSTAPY